ncbi:hypothetical protein [Streptomyces sp. NPDC091278]|uniref:hypothetical protein n=1 Tax=Streptomyces sp. NPDC091278 TaxID=3155301 RepID=UPI00344FA3DE
MSPRVDKPLTRSKAAKRLGVFPDALPDASWSSGWVRAVRKQRPRPQWLDDAYRTYRETRQEQARQRDHEEQAVRPHRAPEERPVPTAAPAPRGPRPVYWVSVPMLRARGWTDASIRSFLPAPEHTRANPHFSSAGAPQALWSPRTVGRAEAEPEWRVWLEGSLARRRTTLAALAFPDADDVFLDKLQRVQDAIDAAARQQS